MGNNQEKPKSKFMVFEDDSQGSSDYKDLKGEVKKMCNCSYRVKLIVFVVCCILGWLLSILAVVVYFTRRDVTYFAVLYCLGQLINLVGTCFLAGPVKQFKNMTEAKRIIVSAVYVASTVGTILFALLLPQTVALTVVCLIVSMVSYFLYCLSYIPFGQKILRKACACCFNSVASE